jgi:hypothetical protein
MSVRWSEDFTEQELLDALGRALDKRLKASEEEPPSHPRAFEGELLAVAVRKMIAGAQDQADALTEDRRSSRELAGWERERAFWLSRQAAHDAAARRRLPWALASAVRKMSG